MKKNNNRVMALLAALLLVLTTTSCGKVDMASVAEENATVAPATEEPTTEYNTDETYVVNYNLTYTDDTTAATKGTLYVGEDTDTLDVIDVDWELTNIVISDAEDGTQSIVIEQEAHGYIWTDGDVFKTNLNLPIARLCDAYTGKVIDVDADTDVEWKDNSYTISATEASSWEDGDWSTDWVEDPDGGERLPSTLKVTTTVKVTEGYEGLSLVLSPIVDANGSVDGDFIMDVWTDGSYLFNVNDLSSNFDIIEATDETASEEETTEEEAAETEETETEETKPTETTAPTATPKEEAKPVHTHSYNGVVTTQGTCTVPEVKTYTCSCGDSYTENLGTTAHNFTEPVYGTVHHDEVWQNVPRTVTVKIIECRCGARFSSNDEFQAHSVERINAGYFICGGSCSVDETTETVYDYVKVSDAYDEQTIISYKCSVCGQQK